jgi:LPPG:FO 2-phospho-L-lactate transferase
VALDEFRQLRVAALAGGVGGAKLADGLAQVLPAGNLSVIVNVADDFEYYGLSISPDLDTVMYTLAGIANPETGWGIRDDTFHCLETLQQTGAPAWFRIGDRDLATHLARSRWLWEGEPLTKVTRRLCASHGVEARILPATDDMLRTIVETGEGDLEFQDYFVRRRCEPAVRGFRFNGLPSAFPTREVLAALESAHCVIFCPSNPFVSIAPILALPGIRERVAAKPSAAVTPIIGGTAVKGPAAKMMRELGREPAALEVAREYAGLARGFLLDRVDAGQAEAIAALGMRVRQTDTLMGDSNRRREVALEALRLATDDSDA